MQNNRVVLNTIKTSNKNMRELLIKDSTKLANKLNTCNLKWRKLCGLSTISRFNKYVWLNSKKSPDTYFAHKIFFKETC